jgi:hypothetical protein
VAYVAAVSPPTGGASQPDNGQDLISSLAIRARQREIESLRQPFAQGERQIQKVADKLAADPRTGGHEV